MIKFLKKSFSSQDVDPFKPLLDGPSSINYLAIAKMMYK